MIEVPELQYMPYKDGQIAFRESGDGPAIFLLHGMNGDSRSWAYLFPVSYTHLTLPTTSKV